MVSRKYVGDYRLENVPDRRGKLKTVPVYRGPLFRFKAEESKVKAAKRRCLLLTFLETAAVMPLVLCILPTVLLWMGLYNLFTAGETVPRDRCDRIHNRFAGWSVVLLVLSAFSMIGQITAYIGSSTAENVPVTICTVVIMFCAAFLFGGKKDLLMEEIPAEP